VADIDMARVQGVEEEDDCVRCGAMRDFLGDNNQGIIRIIEGEAVARDYGSLKIVR
jgi:hypothetical protein